MYRRINLGIAAVALILSGQSSPGLEKGPNVEVDGIRYEALGHGPRLATICQDSIDRKIYYTPEHATLTVRREGKRMTFPISTQDHVRMLEAGYGSMSIDGTTNHVKEISILSQKPEPREIFEDELIKSSYREVFDWQAKTYKSCRERA